MSDPERLILDFMRQSTETKFSRKEISRRAIRRQEYEQNPHWADAALAALVARDEITLLDNGLYQLATRER